MAAITLVIALVALAFAGCGEEEDEMDTVGDAVEASVCDVVERADELGEVLVEGDAYVPSERGFVLSGGKCSIFVAAPTKESTSAREGTAVTVSGLVEPMHGDEVGVIERLIAERTDRSDPDPRILRRVEVGAGKPYIDAFSVRGEDLVESGG